MPSTEQQFEYMREALALAAKAEETGEVPVGAVVVSGSGEIIGRGYNRPIQSDDCTAHAEMEAIREACEHQSNYRLTDCDMYVSLEPCAMCAGAIVHARIKNLYYAASDQKTGACGSVFDVVSSNPTGHRVMVESGLMADESRQLIQSFFKRRREEKKQQKG